MIETHDLTKVYGQLHAINRVELKLERGDVFGFIGPNGAGKTTTMRDLATLLRPTWAKPTSAAIRFTQSRKRFAASSATCPTSSAFTTI